MNHLRQKGFLRYSRKGIQVYAEALREHLQNETGQNVQWPARDERSATSRM
jgi:protoporphyrinogen oxidase